MSDEEAELIFKVGSLRVSVSGPVEECVTARRRILSCLGTASPEHSPRSFSSFSVLDPPAASSEQPRASTARGPARGRGTGRDDVLSSFPPLPDRWASQAGTLHSSIHSGLGRLTRAWVAGNWAKATLEGRVPSPAHTPVLNIPAKLYVVLRAPGLERPALVGSSAAYFDIVGRPFGRETVSRSFPSLLEVRVLRRSLRGRAAEAMNLSEIQDATFGAPQVLILGWPEEDGGPPVVEAYALCLMKRQGGLLLAVPALFFDEELLASAQAAPPTDVLGPSGIFDCSGAILEGARQVEHASRLVVVVVDCSDAICTSLRVAQLPLEEGPEPFSQDDCSLVPFVPSLLPQVDTWLRDTERMDLYSVDEAEVEGGTAPKAKAPKSKAKAKMSPASRKMNAARTAGNCSGCPAGPEPEAGRTVREAVKDGGAEPAGLLSRDPCAASSQTTLTLAGRLGAKGPGRSKACSLLVGPPPKVRSLGLLQSTADPPATALEAQEHLLEQRCSRR